MPDCLFCRIVAGEIPSTLVHETENTYAFADITPQAPTHVLVVPKTHVEHLHALADLGLAAELVQCAQSVAEKEGIVESGYRVVANIGADGGMAVAHLHLHVLGGRSLGWPPG